MKSIPYELVFGQPPRKTVFPGVTTSIPMEEDVFDIVEEGILFQSTINSSTHLN